MSGKLVAAVIGAIIVIGGITVLATHNSSNMDSMSMNGSSASSTAVASSSVTIKSYAFSSMVVKVKVGTTVTWTNQDSVHHTVTVDSGTTGPKSSPFGQGQTYSYTFKTAGTYNYHCDIHPQMHGTVIVTG